MKQQMRIFAFLASVGLLGVFSSIDLSGGLSSQEVKASVAEELVGGATCERFTGKVCNAQGGTGCPTNAGFTPKETGQFLGQPLRGLVTCGCVRRPGTGCSTAKFYQKLTGCGGSGS